MKGVKSVVQNKLVIYLLAKINTILSREEN